MGRTEGTGERAGGQEGRSVPLAALQAQSHFSSGVRGPGNESGLGVIGQPGRGGWSSGPSALGGSVAQRAASSWPWRWRTRLVLCPHPSSVEFPGPPEASAESPFYSHYTSGPRLGARYPPPTASSSRTLASGRDTWPGGHSASATHSGPSA